MTRHIRRASALFVASALFAAGAWGQSTEIRQWASSINVASEYFGTADGRELGRDVKGNGAPVVTLTIHGEADTAGTTLSGQIDSGNIAHITYTLQGATFAETVSSSNLTAANLGGAAIETEIVSGGSEGDSSVTIEVEVTNGNIVGDTTVTNTYGPTGNLPSFEFEVPMLQATGAVLSSDPNTGDPTAVGVGITSSIAVRRSRGNPFPGSIQGADADGVRTSGSETVGAKFDPILVPQSQVYNTALPGLAFNWVAPFSQTEEVDVKDRKAIIALGAMAKDPSVKDQTKAGPALQIGQINITVPATIPKDLGGDDAAVITFESDGVTALDATDYEVGDGLSGDAMVMVAGPFQSGDKVYLGSKTMSISGGMATGMVDIESLLQSTAGLKVIYVPGGVDDLKPSSFYGSAKLDFDDSDNSSRVSAGPRVTKGFSVGKLEYDGFDPQGYAYGVIGSGGGERSFVRIGCTSGSGCRVFLDCTDEAGMPYFGELPQIGGNATSVANSDDIADALDGGWSTGKGSCSLVSDAGLEIQHMVRTGEALANSSVVVNKEVAAFPTIPSAATYDCVPGDADGDGSTNEGEQVCSPQ